MNATQFVNLIEKPSAISETETAELSDMITQFPYFQSAHMLYLKGLHQNKSLEYPKELKVTAAYANDRKKLYELIMQQDLHEQIRLVEEYSDKTSSAKTDVSPLEAQILQEAVSASIKLEVSNPPVPIATGTTEEEIDEGEEPSIEEKRAVVTPEPRQVDFSKKRTFSEWLRAAQDPPSTIEATQKESQDEAHLIDTFIGSAPRIGEASKDKSGRQPFFSPIDTARLSLIDDPSFITETLANIYEAQGYLEKAKNAYTLLSLKYPEKRNTFAARIKELENKLKN